MQRSVEVSLLEHAWGRRFSCFWEKTLLKIPSIDKISWRERTFNSRFFFFFAWRCWRAPAVDRGVRFSEDGSSRTSQSVNRWGRWGVGVWGPVWEKISWGKWFRFFFFFAVSCWRDFSWGRFRCCFGFVFCWFSAWEGRAHRWFAWMVFLVGLVSLGVGWTGTGLKARQEEPLINPTKWLFSSPRVDTKYERTLPAPPSRVLCCPWRSLNT